MLYTGQVFRASAAWASRNSGGTWWILSAMYGLVGPTRILSPYDKTLSKKETEAWASMVIEQIRVLRVAGRFPKPGEAKIVCLAGKDYAEPLREFFEREGYEYVTPLAHLGIGERLAWLKEHQS